MLGLVLAVLGSILTVLSASDLVAPATLLAGGAVYKLLSTWRWPRIGPGRDAPASIARKGLRRATHESFRARSAPQAAHKLHVLDLHAASTASPSLLYPQDRLDRQYYSYMPVRCTT